MSYDQRREKKKQESVNPASGRLGYRFDRRVAGFVPVFDSSRFFRLDRQGWFGFNNLGYYLNSWRKSLKKVFCPSNPLKSVTLISYVLGKSGLVFPKLTSITIHKNSTHSGNTR